MTEVVFREAVVAQLGLNEDQLKTALRLALKTEFAREGASLVQIEVDPWSLRVVSCPLEEELLPDDWAELPSDRPESADEILSELVFPWIASCWSAAGGPAGASPAYALWHGFDPRFDLEQRRWMPSRECLSPG
jgi:hypothetical protein